MIPITYSAFLNCTGYGQAAQDYIVALNDSGKYDIKIDSFGTYDQPACTKKRQNFLKELQSKSKNANSLQIYHCIPDLQKRKSKTTKSIGCVVYETFNPPRHWGQLLSLNDVVVVPSMFNYNIFNNMGIKSPIFYFPHCLDYKIYHPNVESSHSYPGFSFLFFGSWKKRKGFLQLLEAWFSEFDKNDNVCLVFKTDKVSKAKNELSLIKDKMKFKKKDIAPIFIEDKILDEEKLPKFLKSFNCLILPHVGEGFGLPGLQCMRLGVPIIITNFSGCQDYANNQTATLLNPEGFVLHKTMDNYPQFANKKWAFVSIAEIRKQMRFAYENQDEILKKAVYAVEEIGDKFSYEQCAKRFEKIIETVL